MTLVKKHYIFDLDDTLTDAYGFNQQVFVDALSPYIDVSDPEVDSYVRNLHYNSRGTSMYSQFEEVLKHFKARVPTDQVVKENEILQGKSYKKIKTFSAVEEIIHKLKAQGKDISIFSNRDKISLEGILRTNKLAECFTHIVSCVEEGHEKPDPYCLKELIKKSGLKKQDFIYFGDSKTDCKFAKAAGIDFVIVDHYLNEKKFYKLLLQAFM